MDIELRWVEYHGRLEMDTRRVLQYREKRIIHSATISKSGIVGELLPAIEEWSDWMNVPVVLGQVITPEESQEAPK